MEMQASLDAALHGSPIPRAPVTKQKSQRCCQLEAAARIRFHLRKLAGAATSSSRLARAMLRGPVSTFLVSSRARSLALASLCAALSSFSSRRRRPRAASREARPRRHHAKSPAPGAIRSPAIGSTAPNALAATSSAFLWSSPTTPGRKLQVWVGEGTGDCTTRDARTTVNATCWRVFRGIPSTNVPTVRHQGPGHRRQEETARVRHQCRHGARLHHHDHRRTIHHALLHAHRFPR